ncbi:hypothetical protein JCM8547_007366 [Rhodosporidiobolus lusitaniae]
MSNPSGPPPFAPPRLSTPLLTAAPPLSRCSRSPSPPPTFSWAPPRPKTKPYDPRRRVRFAPPDPTSSPPSSPAPEPPAKKRLTRAERAKEKGKGELIELGEKGEVQCRSCHWYGTCPEHQNSGKKEKSDEAPVNPARLAQIAQLKQEAASLREFVYKLAPRVRLDPEILCNQQAVALEPEKSGGGQEGES